MYRPLLMMRTRGLSGSRFCKHANLNRLTKSAGNFIGLSGGSIPPDVGDRIVLCLDGATTQVEINYVPDPTKDTVIGCYFSLSELPPLENDFVPIWGVDADMFMSVNNVFGPGSEMIRVGLFGAKGNKPNLGILTTDEWYACSLAWPSTSADGVARLNNKPQSTVKGTDVPTNNPLTFGWRYGGGFDRFVQTLAEIQIWEDGELVHHYPLDEDTGTDAIDVVGGLTGTIINPTWCENPLYVPPLITAIEGWTGLPFCIDWGAFAGWTGDQNCGEDIGGQVPTVGTLAFPDATEGQPYNYDLSTIISNATSYGYNGTLPADIDFDSSTGIFSSDIVTESSISSTMSVYGVNEYGQSADSNSDELTVVSAETGCVLTLDGTSYVDFCDKIRHTESFTYEVDMQIDDTVSDTVSNLSGITSVQNGRLYVGRRTKEQGREFLFGAGSVFYHIPGSYWADGERHKLTMDYLGSNSWNLYLDDEFVTSLTATPNTNPNARMVAGITLNDHTDTISNYIIGKLYSAKYINHIAPAEGVAYTFNSGDTEFEPSDNYPDDRGYDAIYRGIELNDWDCP